MLATPKIRLYSDFYITTFADLKAMVNEFESKRSAV